MSRLARVWDGGTYTAHSMAGLGPKRRLRDCNVEEVKAHFRGRVTGLEFDAGKANKRAARERVLDLFGTRRYPEPIKILTMPGVKWKFEGALLNQRDCQTQSFREGPGPALTEVHAVENDRAVYYEALLRAPGISNPANVIKDLGATAYAERVLSYLWIKRYIFADADDLLLTGETYDCAWLDYFGPMTVERLRRLRHFFEHNVRGTLVFTNLRSRWNPRTGSALREHANYEAWMRAEFTGAQVEHYLEYHDTVPMVQFAISKEGSHG